MNTRFKLSELFDDLILSYELGFCKPEPEIYHEALRRGGVTANQCLFIDDLAENVRGAEAIGMRTIQFQGFDDLNARLRKLGML
jgi:putative hydrolase of the HAD superfamily